MKIKQAAASIGFVAVLVPSFASMITSSAVAQNSEPSADTVTYSCNMDPQTKFPTTFGITGDGQGIPIISWQSKFFEGSGWSPAKRCVAVSQRMERYRQQGLLSPSTYLVGATMGKERVICVSNTSASDQECTSNRLLLTLQRGDTYEGVIKSINAAILGDASSSTAVRGPIIRDGESSVVLGDLVNGNRSVRNVGTRVRLRSAR